MHYTLLITDSQVTTGKFYTFSQGINKAFYTFSQTYRLAAPIDRPRSLDAPLRIATRRLAVSVGLLRTLNSSHRIAECSLAVAVGCDRALDASHRITIGHLLIGTNRRADNCDSENDCECKVVCTDISKCWSEVYHTRRDRW